MRKKQSVLLSLIIIAIGVAITMSILGKGLLAADKEINEEKSYATEGINEIKLKLSSTPVHIIRTPAGESVKFHFYGKSKRDIKLITEAANGAITAETKFMHNAIPLREETFLDVYIPENYKNNLSIKITSGMVKMDSIRFANLSLDSSSGGLEAVKLTAHKMTVTITSGKLDISGLDVKEFALNGSSSDVRISCRELIDSKIKIETSSGDVTLALPNNAEFFYDIAMTSGKLKSDFPISSQNSNTRKVKGQIGAKNNTVSVKTTSGSIEFLKR